MLPDDELCLCFHVTQRKVLNFLRVKQPRRLSQMADCLGAGTGCGWCRPFLKKLFQAAQKSQLDSGPIPKLPSADEYAQERSKYVRAGKGSPPPGATSVEPE